jgi:hypothetical protein
MAKSAISSTCERRDPRLRQTGFSVFVGIRSGDALPIAVPEMMRCSHPPATASLVEQELATAVRRTRRQSVDSQNMGLSAGKYSRPEQARAAQEEASRVL